MVKINYKSDFKINEKSETIALEVPFVFSYYVFDSKKYVVSFDGHNYVNCKRKEDGSLDIIFNNPNLGVGHLKVERKYAVDDKAFADGVFDVVTVDKTDVFITSGKTFETYIETLVVPPFLKGDKGDPMTWDTMTETERGELVHDVAEAIDPEMVMTENEKARQEAERSRQTAEQQRSSTFNTLKGGMQSAITAGNTAAGNAQKVVDNYDAKVAEQDGKLSELGSELGVTFIFDLNDSTNWHSGEINTSSGEEIIPSNFYIISDRFVLNEQVKNIKVTNTNNRNSNTVVFCWGKNGIYLGFKASSDSAAIADVLESYPSAYSFAIRLVGTDVSIINTDAIWDRINLSPLKHDGSSRLDAIETDIKSITDEIDKIGLELGLDNYVSLNNKKIWHIGEIDTSTGEERPSLYYIITEKLSLKETPKNIPVTNTNSRDSNTVLFCYDYEGNYIGFYAYSNNAAFLNAANKYPLAYWYIIRLAASNTDIIGVDAIWDDVEITLESGNGGTRLEVIEENIQKNKDGINELEKRTASVQSLESIINDVIYETTVVGKNIYNNTPIYGYISGSGVITPDSDKSGRYYYSGKIEVKPNTYYYLFGRTLSSAPCVAVELEDGSISKVLSAADGSERAVDYYLPDENNTGTAINGQFLTPNNAKYVLFNLYFSSTPAEDMSFNDNIMLVKIGGSYIDNYDVGEYEPYREELKKNIKSLSLPIVDNLEEGGKEKVLSAEQGKKLKQRLDGVSKAVKVLLIGSSHGANTIGQFPILAYHSGVEVICGNFYKGGMTLEEVAAICKDDVSIKEGNLYKFTNGSWRYFRIKTMRELLESETWDFIALQRSASFDMTWTSEQSAHLDTVISYITKVCSNAPHIVFNSGFADTYSLPQIESQRRDSETIWNTALQVKEEYGLEIIPMAPILQNCRNIEVLANLGTSENKMLSMDTQHLDTGIGMYVSGCVCFNFFLRHLGMDVLACQYLPSYEDALTFRFASEETFTPIEESYAKLIRREVAKWYNTNNPSK